MVSALANPTEFASSGSKSKATVEWLVKTSEPQTMDAITICALTDLTVKLPSPAATETAVELHAGEQVSLLELVVLRVRVQVRESVDAKFP